MSEPTDANDASAHGKLEAEKIAHALATRHGFRARDYSITWDGGVFEPERETHELTITSGDGRQSVARIAAQALQRADPWIFLREIDAAFAVLSRRPSARGV